VIGVDVLVLLVVIIAVIEMQQQIALVTIDSLDGETLNGARGTHS